MLDNVIAGLIPLLVVAIVELLKRLNKKDYEGVLLIIIAALVGSGAGFLQLQGLDVVTGTVAGLEAVGIHTLTSRVSSK